MRLHNFTAYSATVALLFSLSTAAPTARPNVYTEVVIVSTVSTAGLPSSNPILTAAAISKSSSVRNDNEHTVTAIATASVTVATAIHVPLASKSSTKVLVGDDYSVWDCANGHCGGFDEAKGDHLRKARAQKRDSSGTQVDHQLDIPIVLESSQGTSTELGRRYEFSDCPSKATNARSSTAPAGIANGVGRRYEKSDCQFKSQMTEASVVKGPTPIENKLATGSLEKDVVGHLLEIDSVATDGEKPLDEWDRDEVLNCSKLEDGLRHYCKS